MGYCVFKTSECKLSYGHQPEKIVVCTGIKPYFVVHSQGGFLGTFNDGGYNKAFSNVEIIFFICDE